MVTHIIHYVDEGMLAMCVCVCVGSWEVRNCLDSFPVPFCLCVRVCECDCLFTSSHMHCFVKKQEFHKELLLIVYIQ